MKLALVLIILFLLTQTIIAQDHFAAERMWVDIPSSQTTTSAGIAAYINLHYKTEDDKIAAIYSWITSNIRYDADTIHYVILDEDNEERVTWALSRKRGVCENFAAIFTDVAGQCGIDSWVAQGYTRQDGSVDRAPHAWCIAKVNGRWGLYDPTWDAGSARTSSGSRFRYFDAPATEFIQTHLPFDPVCQLLEHPVTYREFEAGRAGRTSPDNFLDFSDSLAAMKEMDRLSRYESELARIGKAGWPSSLVETKIKRLRFQMEVLNQDADADLYNSAVDNYNSAASSLNVFLNYRNHQLQPSKSNTEIQLLFQDVSGLINAANEKIRRINRSKATLQLDTTDLGKKLQELQANLQEQRAFFRNYNDTAAAKE